MAASLQRGGLAKLGKRFVQGNWIPSFPEPSAPVSSFRRGGHSSTVYDKNVDDQVRPTVVPDDVIQAQSSKYWAPHPQTGVFGPAEQEGRSAGGRISSLRPPPDGSVLEQQAWFRPLEDVDKSDDL